MLMYINYENIYDDGYTGIRNKIISQCRVLKKEVDKVYLVWRSKGVAYLSDTEHIIEKKPAVSRFDYKEALIEWIDYYNTSRIFIRKPLPCDAFLIDLLNILCSKKIRIVIEIPTYPYDGEGLDMLNKVEDYVYIKDLPDYNVVIATSSEEKKIWNIPCIRMSNGVDVKSISFVEKKIDSKRIIMVAAAATLMWWQGYDRLIEGLYQFKSDKMAEKYNIRFILVGSGGDENKYRNLVEKYGLQEYVEFMGLRPIEEVREVLDCADVAISSLGRHRSGINRMEPIKTAEYCAKGLPIICSYEDTRFDGKYPYIYRFPADESPINVKEIVEFVNSLRADTGYRNKIRKYAEDRLDWNHTMKNVVEYFIKY